jgi:predicted CDP-diglyceride synthetase/phosphatidate cytidylyltransferase
MIQEPILHGFNWTTKTFGKDFSKKIGEGFFEELLRQFRAWLLGNWFGVFTIHMDGRCYVISVSGTLGDLFGRCLSERGVKDSGSIMPGHGDSLTVLSALSLHFAPLSFFVSFWNECQFLISFV